MHDLTVYLDDIERRIDEEQESRIWDAWRAYADGGSCTGPFVPPTRVPAPSRIEWPDIHINDAVGDETLMVISQFKLCSDMLGTATDVLLSVRANYGVGIIPTMWGCELYVMPRDMQTLPNVRTLHGGVEAIRRVAEHPAPPFDSGLGARVTSIGKRYVEIRQRYPKIARWIRVDHPDCQGPMDLCELLWGSNLFVALYDEPKLVHAVLRRITDFYKSFVGHWFDLVPNTDDYHAFFGRLHKGAITLRDDSAMNLSPAFFSEFIRPYDEELLLHFGGGAIHFCGRGEHFIDALTDIGGLYAVDISQPHLNDMNAMLIATVDKGVNLFAAKGTFLDDIDRSDESRHAWRRVYVS